MEKQKPIIQFSESATKEIPSRELENEIFSHRRQGEILQGLKQHPKAARIQPLIKLLQSIRSNGMTEKNHKRVARFLKNGMTPALFTGFVPRRELENLTPAQPTEE